MKVFIAGATGAVGRPTVERLIAAGHTVVGMAASADSAAVLERMGASVARADALDGEAVMRAVGQARPGAVVLQLTSLPEHYTPREMQAAAERDRRVRLEGGGNLVSAALAAGVRRVVVSSGAYFYAPGDGLADEGAPFAFDATPGIAASARLLADVEQQVLGESRFEAVALRYGFFYGPGTWYWPDGDMADQVRTRRYPIVGDGRGVWSFVHVEDAAAATLQVLESARPDRIYNVTDNEPSELRRVLPAFARWVGAPEPPRVATADEPDVNRAYYANRLRGASNAKAKRELGFEPRPAPWFAADLPTP
jgi:nucleoside-diphosphate-sugar epimerase